MTSHTLKHKRQSHGDLIRKLQIKTCSCGRKLRGEELQCKDCREKELLAAEGD